MDKEKFADLKKFIKEENPSTQRLQSLKLPRDLNLGGSKIVKKQFIPNLNVVRNKDKVKDVTKKIEHKRNIRNNDRFVKKNNKYIQSSGIFSEGMGLDAKKTRNGIRRGNTKENDYTSTMTVPTIKKNVWEFNKKNEESVFDEIMANGGEEEEEEDGKLPFQIISWNEKDFKDVPVPVKTEIKCDIKTETDEVSDLPVNKIKLENSDFPIEEYQDGNTCSDHHPRLTLWRLPDSFAGKTLSDDPKCKLTSDYTLSHMPEGQIGKLVLRKSGRVEIHIGRMKYNLEPAEGGSCREEIVAFNVDENQDSSAAVLGQIQNRFMLNPDWDSLFNESKL